MWSLLATIVLSQAEGPRGNWEVQAAYFISLNLFSKCREEPNWWLKELEKSHFRRNYWYKLVCRFDNYIAGTVGRVFVDGALEGVFFRH